MKISSHETINNRQIRDPVGADITYMSVTQIKLQSYPSTSTMNSGLRLLKYLTTLTSCRLRLVVFFTALCGAACDHRPIADAIYCGGKAGTLDERIAACTRAISSGKLDPKDLAETLASRGVKRAGIREYDEAILDFTTAIRLKPDDADTYYNRGLVWHYKESHDHAIADYGEAIRLNPNYTNAYYNRGHAWYAKRDFDHALADYTEAIRLYPQLTAAHRIRGDAWHNKGDYDHAIADYDEAIRLNPKDDVAYFNRGRAWQDKRQPDRAMEDYHETVRLNPQDASGYNNLSWLLATAKDNSLRNGKRAVELAIKACELSDWMDGNIIGTLAAAHAETGNYKEALRWQGKALLLLSDEENKQGRMHLEHYRASKPYRE
jgi:tetratricopeptide (TPR) repeat protein